MANGNPAYVTNNMGDDTFANLGVDVLVLMQPSGDIAFSKGYDPSEEMAVTVPADFLSRLRTDPVLFQKLGQQESGSGIVMSSKGPLLIAARAILTSQEKGPRRGTLIMGYYLDANFSQQLAHITDLQLDIIPLDQLSASADVAAVQSLQQNAAADSIAIQPQSETMVGGYTLLTDMTGTPVLLMRVGDTRDVYLEGQATLRYFLIMLSCAILIYGIFTLIFLEQAILSRLAKLSASVVRIGERGDFSARVQQKVSDELGKLAGAINKMLAALGESHRVLMRYQLLSQYTREIVLFIRARDGTILEANHAAVVAYGYTHEELLRKTVYDLRAPQARADTAAQMAQADTRGILFETIHCHKGGSTFPVEVSSIGATIENERILLSVVRDITERKRAEEQIKRQLAILTTLYASAQKFAQSLDSLELAREVAHTCMETFDLQLAWVGRTELDGRVRVMAQSPAECEYPQQVTIRWDDSAEGNGPMGQAIRTRTPVIVNDLLSEPTTMPWHVAMGQNNLHSGSVLPLVSRQHAFGALALYSDQPSYFTPERIAFFQSYALLAATVLENARLFEETERRLRNVQALHKIDTAIASSLDLHTTLDVILAQTIAQLNVDAADILLYDAQAHVLIYTAGRGFRTGVIPKTCLQLDVRYAGIAAAERRTIVSDRWQVSDVRCFSREYLDLLDGEGFAAHVVTPLIVKDQVVGVLEVFHRAPLDTNTEWLELLETLAGQAAIAIDSATVLEGLQRSNAELEQAYNLTLEGWSRALDLRDKNTEGHTLRVTEVAEQLARAFGMSDAEIVNVRRGALLHDIGKLGVPDSILLKPGKLTEQEWEIMRRHPQYAFEMLLPITYLRPALDIPYCHHEKWDGTGYPRGLKGEQIPLAARIFAVVDVWDALTSDRPYRPAWPVNRAREHIRKQAGSHFDPQVVNVFFELGMDRRN
jgi:PAS domain S-box-containing protein/putative nucleotidyltransferase with HDIG domain